MDIASVMNVASEMIKRAEDAQLIARLNNLAERTAAWAKNQANEGVADQVRNLYTETVEHAKSTVLDSKGRRADVARSLSNGRLGAELVSMLTVAWEQKAYRAPLLAPEIATIRDLATKQLETVVAVRDAFGATKPEIPAGPYAVLKFEDDALSFESLERIGKEWKQVVSAAYRLADRPPQDAKILRIERGSSQFIFHLVEKAVEASSEAFGTTIGAGAGATVLAVFAKLVASGARLARERLMKARNVRLMERSGFDSATIASARLDLESPQGRSNLRRTAAVALASECSNNSPEVINVVVVALTRIEIAEIHGARLTLSSGSEQLDTVQSEVQQLLLEDPSLKLLAADVHVELAVDGPSDSNVDEDEEPQGDE